MEDGVEVAQVEEVEAMTLSRRAQFYDERVVVDASQIPDNLKDFARRAVQERVEQERVES